MDVLAHTLMAALTLSMIGAFRALRWVLGYLAVEPDVLQGGRT